MVPFDGAGRAVDQSGVVQQPGQFLYVEGVSAGAGFHRGDELRGCYASADIFDELGGGIMIDAAEPYRRDVAAAEQAVEGPRAHRTIDATVRPGRQDHRR